MDGAHNPLANYMPSPNVSLSASSPPTPAAPPILPVGDPRHHLVVDVCVVHRCPEVVDQECTMELTLVVVTAGTRSPVSLVELQWWIVDGYGIPGNSFSVK
jgi:hypothetical protein